MIDQAWQQGAVGPAHLVSDGDHAIAAGWRTAARRLRAAESVAEAQRWAPRVIALTGGQAR